MAASWTLNQIIEQLDEVDEGDGFEYEWLEGTGGKVILYAFPTSASEMEALDDEPDGFTAVGASTKTQLRIAVQTWDDLIPWTFQETSGATHHLEFGFTDTDIGYAHAYLPVPFDFGDEILDEHSSGSVWFSSDPGLENTINDLTNVLPGTYGFNTYLHEIGHALGLDHMGDYHIVDEPWSFQDTVVWSVMSYFGPDEPGTEQGENWDYQVGDEIWTYMPQTPQISDIAAIQSMYGTSTTTRTGATVYGFNSSGLGSTSTASLYNFATNQDPILTIFDSTGIDTLDLSGWSTSSEISLVPGTLSSGNGMTNNLGIAYSTTIENAIGGSAADLIVGNSAANVLTGNGGGDLLKGGGGNDTLHGGAGNDDLQGEGGTDTAVLTGNFADYTVTFIAQTGAIRLVSGATGTDTTTGIENYQFADIVKTAVQLVPNADATAPTLSSVVPVDGATSVSVASNIVFTFSEAVQAGSGNITIFRSNGSVAQTISVSDTSQATFSGATLTLNPSADLDYNAGYYINIAAGAIEDAAGNDYAGITGSTALNFTTQLDDYTFDVDTTGIVTVGGAATTGSISFNGDKDLFKVTLQAGQTYVLQLNSTGLADPLLRVYNAFMLEAASDDDSGGGVDARIVFTANTTGLHYLGAMDVSTGTGGYTVSAVQANVMTGTVNADTLTGGSGVDLVSGLAGNDVLRGNAGDDSLEGGDGIDTAVYGGLRAAYDVTVGSDVEVEGTDGDDVLSGVERLEFSDINLALDLSGNAGLTARTLGAVFGAAAVENETYAGIGIDLLDGGMSYETLMGLALTVRLGAAATNADVVNLLYTNLMGSAPDTDTLNVFVGILDSGAMTRGTLGTFAANTSYNAVNIGLDALAQNGLEYL